MQSHRFDIARLTPFKKSTKYGRLRMKRPSKPSTSAWSDCFAMGAALVSLLGNTRGPRGRGDKHSQKRGGNSGNASAPPKKPAVQLRMPWRSQHGAARCLPPFMPS